MAVTDPSNMQALNTLGVPGLVFVIVVLAGVVVFLFRKLDLVQTKIDSIQEQRVTDAKETRDKITEPLEKQANLSEKIYDLLLSSRGK